MGSTGQALLLNRDGFWVSSSDPGEAWGFMFGRGDTFASRYPAEWKRFLSEGSGSFQSENGMFTFRTVRPLPPSHHSSTGSARPDGEGDAELSHQDYFWVVVSRLSGAEVPRVSLARYPSAALGVGLALVLLALFTGYLVSTILGRRELRQAIEENERHLRELTEALGVGVYASDDQGQITYANPEAARLLGWPIEELLGRDAHSLFHHHAPDGTWLPALQSRLNQVVLTGRSYRSDGEVFWRRDGAPLPVEVSCHPMRGEDGRVGLVTAFQDVSDRKRDEETVRRLAYCDPLTGLPNRRMLTDLLTQALAQAEHHRRALAVMFLDLDHFKRVNDGLGHHAGDELLKIAAARLQQCVRRGDTVSRLGGDEFVVLLSEIAQPRDAALVAEKIIGALAAPVILGGQRVHVTTSVGIAVFPGDAADDAVALLKKADLAMYEAKAMGRNTYRFHGSQAAPVVAPAVAP
jgi:diguanylate cyclase (GGDEF)-like protein/PAS domain S-box-containing protein